MVTLGIDARLVSERMGHAVEELVALLAERNATEGMQTW